MIRRAVDLQSVAREQFERRSAGYQGGFAQRVYCRPTSRLLLNSLSLAPGSRVLDVGCGTGQLLADIRARYPDVQLHGLDLCPGMIRGARGVLGTNAELVEGPSQSLPFSDNYFDAVVCTHCFHHFPDQLRSLHEMARVLRPGGTAMILDGDRDGLWGRLLYDVFVMWAEGPVIHRSAAEMERLMRESGFTGVEQARGFPLSPALLSIGRVGKSQSRGLS